jgi:hypothetical protein
MFRLSFAWKFQGMPLIILVMLNFKFLSILGLLLSFVTSNEASAQAADTDLNLDEASVTNNKSLEGGPYIARVITPKAVVYADENMNSPLGYIANGKTITVGNPRRLNRELVPVVVYGRVAFVEIKNLQYENSDQDSKNSTRGAPREHNFDVMLEKAEEKLSENNSFYLGFHSYGAGDDTKKVFEAVDGESEDTFTGFHAQIIHRQALGRFFWGANFDSSSISSDNVKLETFMIAPTVGLTFLRNSVFLIDVYGSLDISIGTKLDISNNFEKEPSGVIWGFQGNARIVLFPEAKYHVAANIGLRRYSVSKLSPLIVEDGINPSREIDGIKSIAGVNLGLSFGMEFR